MLGLNFLTPLYYGDDYVYAFIWNNQFMNVPLPEHVTRINSVSDIFISQWRHYFTGNGRLIAHLFVQFFIWKGKWLFNFFNSLVFIILILEIHWISDAGKISFKNLRLGMLCWIFFALWTFVIGFWSVYLWLAGACNYLWSVTFLLAFLLLYIRKYFNGDAIIYDLKEARLWIFLIGVCAGWTNENTICWVILIMGVWFYKLAKIKQLENWMIYGYIGLCLGYVLLIIAPGNTFKTNYYLEKYFMNDWLNIFSEKFLNSRLITFGIIEFWQIFLWLFVLFLLNRINTQKQNMKEEHCKYITLAKVFCALSLLSNVIMLFTPDFPFRSGFPSLVFLVITSVLLMRVNVITSNTYYGSFCGKKILTIVCSSIFTITLISTYWGYYLNYQYDLNMVNLISAYKNSDQQEILTIPPFSGHSLMLHWLSGQHLTEPDLTENEMDWKNVAVARYYAIKGIKVGKK